MRGGLFLPHLKEEGEGVVSQLAEQLLLDLGVSQFLFVLQLGVNLPGHHKQVPLEGHTHHIHVRAAIPKCARQHHIHWRHIKASQHDVKYCLTIEMLDTSCLQTKQTFLLITFFTLQFSTLKQMRLKMFFRNIKTSGMFWGHWM